MKILGIMWEQNSTAALVVDGRVIASVSEERFSRKKNDEAYPKRAIEYVLQEGGIEGKDLDAVAFIGTMWGPAYILTRRYSNFSLADSVREQHEYWYPVLYQKKTPDFLTVFKNKIDLVQYPGKRVWREVIRYIRSNHGSGRSADKRNESYFQEFRRSVVSTHIGIDSKKIHFIDHSTGHAMYAYFGSPIREDATVLTADAWGDNVNASVSVVVKGVMKRIFSTPDLLIGRLYRYITLYLGMKPGEHEFKVMGLAAYSKKKYSEPVRKIFEGIQKVSGLGFKYTNKPKDLYFSFKEKLETYRFDAISGGLQDYTEDILVQWVKNAIKKTGKKNILFAGGVAMNVKANMLVQALPGVELFVNPSPDDASQAIGACFALIHADCVRRKVDPRTMMYPLSDAYLGPAIEEKDVEILLRSPQMKKYRVHKNVSPEYVADILAKGKVIGRAAGRSEFGPRALGNRSILADARNPDIIKVINEKIKSRDFWMPFAAVVRESRAHDYLVGYKEKFGSPYMTMAFETTPLAQKDLKAGLHPYDMTCRPQVLKEGKNPEYDAILEAFERTTGVGGLLNTSFNLHGEPVVQTVHDAWRVFQLSDLDAVLLGNTLIEK